MVSVRNDHHLISPTALLCAKARAKYTNMPYAEEIYDEVMKREGDGDGWQGMIFPFLRKIALKSPSIRARVSILEGRYLSTNEAISRFEPCNVLELACGVSSRGLEFTSPNSPYTGNQYIETDLSEMLKTKKEIVGTIRMQEGQEISPNHHFMELNALYNWQLKFAGERLLEKGQGDPSVLVNEGLVMYLNDSERNTLRDNIACFLREYSPNGAWITPDLAPRRVFRANPFFRILLRGIEKRTGRSFSGFKDDAEALAYLSEGGLKGEFVSNSHLVDQLSCARVLGLNSQQLAKIAPSYRACIITLDH